MKRNITGRYHRGKEKTLVTVHDKGEDLIVGGKWREWIWEGRVESDV